MANIYTVAQVNSYIKNMFVQDFMLQSISVKGEVSNCKYHSSGHIYFTLKDMKGTISCVMFAGNRSGLSFRLQEGLQVVAQGSFDVYERDGKYQLYVKKITRDGVGYLYERFEQLKEELAERGMFAPEYKCPIPYYNKTVGIVTAATGAAVRDIINIATRRNPYVQIILYPAIVQGEAAAQSIVSGIRALEEQQVDVMIVGRGGGSIEDLWAFNEEIVAQAVFDCSIPVISAVGHETDTTIIDFVADLRAPTPSAAAELAVCDIYQMEAVLMEWQSKFQRAMLSKIELNRLKVKNLQDRLRILSPSYKIRENRTYAITLEDRLRSAIESELSTQKHRMELYIEKLKGLSPLERLSRGFAYVETEKGQALLDIKQAETGRPLSIHIKNGIVEAEIIRVDKTVTYEVTGKARA